jgi:2-polyprenyl-6-methoxyphenol hydroxylase-like FAD-dependent oxidoreductase
MIHPKQNDGLETHKTPLHILIIGGGIGGLCLAQGLKKSGISVSVYERDQSVAFRHQGYRISLKEEGSRALRDCLPENLFQLTVATAIKSATRMVFLDHHLNQKFAKPIPLLPEDTFFGVHRLTLREILLAGLDGMVHFGKTFVQFEHVPDGRIRASFADGTQAYGDLLVGADGTHSAVRDLLVPDAVIDDLDSAIYGKTPLTPDLLERVPEVLIDSFNRMSDPEGVSLSVATCRKREGWTSALERFAPDLRLTDMPDSLSWTLSHSHASLRGADGLILHRLACDLLKEWPREVARIIEEAERAATFLVTIRSARPVKPWQTEQVTLLGDAIHTMSPGRGEGANTALRDAQFLRSVLAKMETGEIPLNQAKAQYEATMLRYGFEAVATSREHPFRKS